MKLTSQMPSSTSFIPSFWPVRCEYEDRGKIAAQHDDQFRSIGNKLDAACPRAKLIDCLCPSLLLAKLVVESSDLLMSILRRTGVE
ncbi:MAG: hypothetical protein ACYC10_09255 [Allorhizobium sp.]